MAIQGDQARWGLFAAVGALDLVAGGLLAFVNLDDPVMSTIGGVLALAGLAMLVLGYRGYRREKARIH